MANYTRGKHPNSRCKPKPFDYYLKYCVADLVTGCVLWTGQVNRKGYGQIRGEGAHRVFYRELVGPIADTLDHTCEIKCCVNPDHLEPVTRRENVQRYYARGDRRVRNGQPK
jgi:hypothetical protein